MKKILETERLIIREYTEDDFNALYEILSDAGNDEILSEAIRRKRGSQMDKLVPRQLS